MKNLNLFFKAAMTLGVVAFLVSACDNAGTANNAESASNSTVAAGSIVYFDLDRVFSEYDMANDLRSVVETKANSINQEVTRRGTKLDNEAKSFQDKINKGLLTQSTAEIQYNKLQQEQNEFNNYAAQKQQEILEEQQVMMNQIYDAIKTLVDKFNKEKGYAMIIGTQASAQGDLLPFPVVTGLPELDITDAILEGLNAEYVKSKSQKTE